MRVTKSFLGSLAGLAVLALAVGNGCSGDDETPPTGVGGSPDSGVDASRDGAAGGARGGATNVGGSDSGAGGSSVDAGPDGSQEPDTAVGAGGSTGVGGSEAGVGGGIIGVGGADSGAGGTGTGTGGADSGAGGTDSGTGGTDSGIDAAPEAGPDAAPEAGPDAAPDAGPDALPDVVTDADAAAAGLVVCNFNSAQADAGNAGVGLCNLLAGGGGTHDQGTVVGSADDADGSATSGSLQFTTSFEDPDTGDTVRLRTETTTATNWTGRTTLRAKVKVVTAGELQSIRLGVANTGSATTYRYGATYDIGQLPVGEWTTITFDMSAGDAGVTVNSVGKIVFQLAARASDGGDAGTGATVIRVDDIVVE